MPVKRSRRAGGAQSKELLSREMRRSRMALFIQQFEKEGPETSLHPPHPPHPPIYTPLPPHPSFPSAQERMNDLEVKMENMLATVDKVFKVEIMKMPPSLQNTLIGDLMSGESPPSSFTRSVLHLSLTCRSSYLLRGGGPCQ